jgi:molybdopterin-guanine dinucleotide biosynthesis protein A
MTTIHRHDITGLVLAGGRASRMGGVDKGLQLLRGVPLALHALQRLQPQVGTVMINTNRNLLEYEFFGAPVLPDTVPDFAGPLAGFIAGLERCQTPWMASVPCDTPDFPADLVARLAAAAAQDGVQIAMPCTLEQGEWHAQPVFSLMQAALLPGLLRYMEGGGRRIGEWARQQRCAEVPFDDARPFFNANTLADLRQLQA